MSKFEISTHESIRDVATRRQLIRMENKLDRILIMLSRHLQIDPDDNNVPAIEEPDRGDLL